MVYTDSGTFIVYTSSASGAIPIEGARVVIKGAGEENRYEEFSQITNRDGLTAPITLITPARANSITPTPQSDAYATYDVEISKDGYFSKKIFNVSVFPGTRSYLPVNMIPIGNDYDAPEENLNTIVTQDLNDI